MNEYAVKASNGPGDDSKGGDSKAHIQNDASIGSSDSAPVSWLVLAGATAVVAGVQFGWALQMSLLTPYVQELGVSHSWTALIWLCGPISGLLVQPYVGSWSDRCTSRLGRRRPFIIAGSILVIIAILLISFSADFGYVLGDFLLQGRPHAVVLFVLGFWLLDLGNNTIQGPCRALIADIGKAEGQELGNAFYSVWMGIGNVLGFAAGANSKWAVWFPSLRTDACDIACADLKAAFLAAVVLLTLCTIVTVVSAKEEPLDEVAYEAVAPGDERTDASPSLFRESEARRNSSSNRESGNNEADRLVPESPRSQAGTETETSSQAATQSQTLAAMLRGPMAACLLVQALSWLSWFPFLLFDTDWMGRDVYRGLPESELLPDMADKAKRAANYHRGVQAGAMGLLLNSVVASVVSLGLKPVCRLFGSPAVWGASNMLRGLLFGVTLFVVGQMDDPATDTQKACAVLIIALLGIPWAVTMVVPYALTAEYTAASGGGQGLAMGVLNLAVVLPQIVVSIYAGPLDALFGHTNEPGFLLAAFWASLSGLAAVYLLPAQRPSLAVPLDEEGQDETAAGGSQHQAGKLRLGAVEERSHAVAGAPGKIDAAFMSEWQYSRLQDEK